VGTTQIPEVADKSDYFGGGIGDTDAVEADARELGQGVDIIVVPNDFEEVAGVEGFAAVDAARDTTTVGFVLHVVGKALLAGRMPAAGHGLFDHGLLGADGALVGGLFANLVKSVGAECVGWGARIHSRVEALEEGVEVHVVCEASSHVRDSSRFLFLGHDVALSHENWVATRLAQTQDLREQGGV
jgi:hypothetical protein